MTDSPEFRKWADAAHRASLQPTINKNRNPRYKCQCGHSTTKNQAKKNGDRCWKCKLPLTALKSSVPSKNSSCNATKNEIEL